MLNLALFALPATGQVSTNPTSISPTSIGPDSIEADLAALEDHQFKVREAAARRFVQRKIDSVEPLAQRALTGGSEASVRAFDILKQLYRDGDDITCSAIESALEELAVSEDVTVASRAESAINGVAQTWHRRAVENFVRLGGKIHYADSNASDEPAEGNKEKKDDADRSIEYAIIAKSWVGGDDGLKYLHRIEDFRVPSEIHRPAALFVIDNSIDKEAIQSLEAALPNLHVQERGAACLGVTPGIQREAEGLLVQDVKVRSAAALAGIQIGDILMQFNGHEVNDFETLVKRIAEKQPGDKIPVILRRNAAVKELTVELREWE